MIQEKKPVIRIGFDGETRYESLREASRANFLDACTISNVCRGLQHLSGGYIWRFDDGAKRTVTVIPGTPMKERMVHRIGAKDDVYYPTVDAAAAEIGIKRDRIYRALRGKSMGTGGYLWEWVKV